MSRAKPSLTMLAFLAVALAALSVAMIFFVAPEDADRGISQKIFYVHVPIALTAYAGFGLGAWKALRLLLTRGERYDLESYSGIHQGTMISRRSVDRIGMRAVSPLADFTFDYQDLDFRPAAGK